MPAARAPSAPTRSGLNSPAKNALRMHRPAFRDAEILHEAVTTWLKGGYVALTRDRFWFVAPTLVSGADTVRVPSGCLGLGSYTYKVAEHPLSTLTKITTSPGSLTTSVSIEFGALQVVATVGNDQWPTWQPLVVRLDEIAKHAASMAKFWSCSYCHSSSPETAPRCESCGAPRSVAR